MSKINRAVVHLYVTTITPWVILGFISGSLVCVEGKLTHHVITVGLTCLLACAVLRAGFTVIQFITYVWGSKGTADKLNDMEKSITSRMQMFISLLASVVASIMLGMAVALQGLPCIVLGVAAAACMLVSWSELRLFVISAEKDNN